MNLHDPLRLSTLPIILLALIVPFGLNVLLADGIASKQKVWGLTPFHIDRGLDRLTIEDSVRHEIDRHASEYYSRRDLLRAEMVVMRQEMVESIESGQKQKLPRMRLKIREVMEEMRRDEEVYVALVTALLENDQISTLLDFDFGWGE